MASDSGRIEWSTPREKVRSMPRAGLRFTSIERKWLLIGFDLVLVNSALVIAAVRWNEFVLSRANLAAYYKWFLTLSILWLVVGTILDIYSLPRAASTTTIIGSAGSAALATTLLYLVIPWLTPPILHRSYAVGFVCLTGALVLSWRVVYARALVHPAFARYGLIVGGTASVLEQVRLVQEAGQLDDGNPFRGTGYAIIGRVADPDVEDAQCDIPLLGHVRKLVRLSRQYGVDEIIVAATSEQELCLDAREVLLDCRELGLQVSSLSSVYERLTGRLPVDRACYDLQLLLSPADSPGARLYAASKRAIDIVLSLIGLAAFAVVMPFIALANVIGSPGPLFYRQERIGKGGRPFTLIKLRSMIPDAEHRTGAVWCDKDDPRITTVGRWLRKSRLDEVPQLINVLRGQMSIVGPRPERPSFVGPLSRTLPLYRARHAVKPGITGWAQVHYEYGDSIDDAQMKLEYDLFYVKHASLYLDLLILLHTVRVVFGLKGQ